MQLACTQFPLLCIQKPLFALGFDWFTRLFVYLTINLSEWFERFSIECHEINTKLNYLTISMVVKPKLVTKKFPDYFWHTTENLQHSTENCFRLQNTCTTNTYMKHVQIYHVVHYYVGTSSSANQKYWKQVRGDQEKSELPWEQNFIRTERVVLIKLLVSLPGFSGLCSKLTEIHVHVSLLVFILNNNYYYIVSLRFLLCDSWGGRLSRIEIESE